MALVPEPIQTAPDAPQAAWTDLSPAQRLWFVENFARSRGLAPCGGASVDYYSDVPPQLCEDSSNPVFGAIRQSGNFLNAGLATNPDMLKWLLIAAAAMLVIAVLVGGKVARKVSPVGF